MYYATNRQEATMQMGYSIISEPYEQLILRIMASIYTHITHSHRWSAHIVRNTFNIQQERERERRGGGGGRGVGGEGGREIERETIRQGHYHSNIT